MHPITGLSVTALPAGRCLVGLLVCWADADRVLTPGFEVVCPNLHVITLSISVK